MQQRILEENDKKILSYIMLERNHVGKPGLYRNILLTF